MFHCSITPKNCLVRICHCTVVKLFGTGKGAETHRNMGLNHKTSSKRCKMRYFALIPYDMLKNYP